MENDYTTPQAAWSAYRDLDFGQASFVIMNETSAEWAWRADDGTSLDQVWDTRVQGLGFSMDPVSRLSAVLACFIVPFGACLRASERLLCACSTLTCVVGSKRPLACLSLGLL